jgi:hypothetical protein
MAESGHCDPIQPLIAAEIKGMRRPSLGDRFVRPCRSAFAGAARSASARWGDCGRAFSLDPAVGNDCNGRGADRRRDLILNCKSRFASPSLGDSELGN